VDAADAFIGPTKYKSGVADRKVSNAVARAVLVQQQLDAPLGALTSPVGVEGRDRRCQNALQRKHIEARTQIVKTLAHTVLAGRIAGLDATKVILTFPHHASPLTLARVVADQARCGRFCREAAPDHDRACR